jgi:hypothetical protein
MLGVNGRIVGGRHGDTGPFKRRMLTLRNMVRLKRMFGPRVFDC